MLTGRCTVSSKAKSSSVNVYETRRGEYLHSILGVTVVFDPTLVNPIDHLPPTARDAFQNKVDILQIVSESPPQIALGRSTRYRRPPLSLFSFSGKKAPILAPVQQKTAIMKGI